MRVQQSRTDVLPLTWEIPAAIAASWLLLALLALPTGQAAAAWVLGKGFAWPSSRLVEVTLEVARGRPEVDPLLVYALIAVLEVVVAAAAALGLSLWWRNYGPGTQYGLASRHQIAAALGPGNLRGRMQIIRPDLATSSAEETSGEGG
jgi:hypothetical protein